MWDSDPKLRSTSWRPVRHWTDLWSKGQPADEYCRTEDFGQGSLGICHLWRGHLPCAQRGAFTMYVFTALKIENGWTATEPVV